MIIVNIQKAKDITHTFRRSKRAEEFAPYDAIIMKQIPGNDFQIAESARQKIREKYAQIQNDIDSEQDVQKLKTILRSLL